MCFELALTFKCDLLTILAWPGSRVAALFEDAREFLAEQAQQAADRER